LKKADINKGIQEKKSF